MSTAIVSTEYLASLITDFPVAILTTRIPDGTLRSRLMATLGTEFWKSLWFFTLASGPSEGPNELEGQVTVSCVDSDRKRFVSISGHAVLVLDRQRLERMWNPRLTAWFPEGLADPLLALLRVDVDSGTYWDAQSGAMVIQGSARKPELQQAVYETGEHERLDLSGIWITQDVGNSKNRNDRI